MKFAPNECRFTFSHGETSKFPAFPSLSTWAIDLVVCTSYYYSNFLWRYVSPYHLLWRKNPVQTRAQMEMKTRLQKLQVGVSAYGAIWKEFKIPSDPQQKWFEFEIANQQISQSLEFGDRSPDFSKKSDGFFFHQKKKHRSKSWQSVDGFSRTRVASISVVFVWSRSQWIQTWHVPNDTRTNLKLQTHYGWISEVCIQKPPETPRAKWQWISP